MFHKCLTAALALSLLQASLAVSLLAQTKAKADYAEGVGPGRDAQVAASRRVGSKEAERAVRVKARIARLGVGFEARAKLRLSDRTMLKGYVSEAGDDYFVVVEDETHEPRRIAYLQVEKLKVIKAGSFPWEKVITVAILAVLIIPNSIGYARK